MREILFKAKRLSDGAWVEGFPYWGEYSGAFILQNKTYSRRNARTGEISMGDNVVPIEVDPSTVCQYTGLTDKNGKKIFEGDIISWPDWRNDQRKAPVRYDDEWKRFCVWLNGAESMGVNKHLSTGGIEVIGNVHDGEGDDDD
jgi:uncharacterized phage protein (TIGR01671 family)|nr:MAG TPA: YopX protein [Caudoviricetes sp.]